jgi:hypothetical protein
MTERIRSSSRMSSVRSAPGLRARAFVQGFPDVTANGAGDGRVVLVLLGPHRHEEGNLPALHLASLSQVGPVP